MLTLFQLIFKSLCIWAKWPISAGAYPGFYSMKWLGVLLLPPGWDASPSQGYPSSKFAVTHLYTWEKRGTVKVKCFAQKCNVVPRPGLKPGLMDSVSSTLTTRPLWVRVIAVKFNSGVCHGQMVSVLDSKLSGQGLCPGLLNYSGGIYAMAKWLVCWTLNWVAWVCVLAETLCCALSYRQLRHFTLTVQSLQPGLKSINGCW